MPPRERQFLATPIVAGGDRVIASPFQFIVTGEDHLRVTVRNSVTNARLRLRLRFLREGEAAPIISSHELTPDALENETAADFPLTNGVILNLVAQAIGAIVEPGRMYVRVDIIRGFTGGTIVVGTVLAGYVGSWGGRAWPGSPLEAPTEGPGWLRLVQSGVPLAGANPQIQFIGQERMRIISARAALTSSAVAADRRPVITIVHGGQVVFQGQSSLTHTAGLTLVHSWGAAVAKAVATGNSMGEGPLPADLQISTVGILDLEVRLDTFNLQGGDQWTALNLLVERWMNPATVTF